MVFIFSILKQFDKCSKKLITFYEHVFNMELVLYWLRFFRIVKIIEFLKYKCIFKKCFILGHSYSLSIHHSISTDTFYHFLLIFLKNSENKCILPHALLDVYASQLDKIR